HASPRYTAGRSARTSESGGTGRRAGLRSRCPQGRGGSSPPSRTGLGLGPVDREALLVVEHAETAARHRPGTDVALLGALLDPLRVAGSAKSAPVRADHDDDRAGPADRTTHHGRLLGFGDRTVAGWFEGGNSDKVPRATWGTAGRTTRARRVSRPRGRCSSWL